MIWRICVSFTCVLGAGFLTCYAHHVTEIGVPAGGWHFVRAVQSEQEWKDWACMSLGEYSLRACAAVQLTVPYSWRNVLQIVGFWLGLWASRHTVAGNNSVWQPQCEAGQQRTIACGLIPTKLGTVRILNLLARAGCCGDDSCGSSPAV